MYKIFLDDERNPEDCSKFLTNPIYLDKDWIIVRSFEDFVYEVMTLDISLISFDHDLGTEKTGKDCANWLVHFCLETGTELPEFLIHSRNTVGTENIKSILEHYKKFVNDL